MLSILHLFSATSTTVYISFSFNPADFNSRSIHTTVQTTDWGKDLIVSKADNPLVGESLRKAKYQLQCLELTLHIMKKCQ